MVAIKDYELISIVDTTPLTLQEVKDFLKIDDDYSDTEISILIKAVIIKAEQITGRDLINKTYKGYLDCFPACKSILVQKSKLQSITSIQYLKDGVLTTFDSSKYYFTKKQEYSSIYLNDGELWATDVDARRQAVEITFVAGYGDKGCDIPADMKSAMLRHLNLLYENRGDCGDEKSINNLIIGLYMPYVVSRKLICPI